MELLARQYAEAQKASIAQNDVRESLNTYIIDWLTSLPASPSTAMAPSRERKRAMPTTPSATTIEDPAAKRRRLSPDGSSRQQTIQQEGEKDRQDIAEESMGQAPKTRLFPLYQRRTPEAASNRPRPGTADSRPKAIQTTLDLNRVELPVTVKEIAHPLDANAKLPSDILPLYTSIRSVVKYQKTFIPAEIRDQIEDVFGDHAQEYWFRESRASKELGRHEDAWNAMVYYPLLNLALCEHRGSAEGASPPEVMAELVTSATIAGDSVPRLNTLRKRDSAGNLRSSDAGSILACSVSVSGASSLSSVSFWDGPSAEQVHSKHRSKKAAFALVLVPPPRLSAAIERACNFDSVNQSLYGPFRDTPIACAMGTKTATAGTDPIVQLAVWTVAWYRRMDALWREVHGKDVNAAAGRSHMVSLPVIIAVDHEWSMYFAVDRGDRIEICGPQKIGFTAGLDDIYMLLASLRLLQQWIETVFYAFLEKWFGCDDTEAAEGAN